MYNLDSYKIGKMIREARKSKGLSVEELANKICKSITTMYKYERDEVIPDLVTILEICNVLELDINDLTIQDRIEVNRELDVLSSALEQAIELLNVGGRICVITFHSLEDRMVKQIFKKYSEVDSMVKGLPFIPEEYKPILSLVGKSITPSNNELEENNRARSSRLRVAEKVKG